MIKNVFVYESSQTNGDYPSLISLSVCMHTCHMQYHVLLWMVRSSWTYIDGSTPLDGYSPQTLRSPICPGQKIIKKFVRHHIVSTGPTRPKKKKIRYFKISQLFLPWSHITTIRATYVAHRTCAMRTYALYNETSFSSAGREEREERFSSDSKTKYSENAFIFVRNTSALAVGRVIVLTSSSNGLIA